MSNRKKFIMRLRLGVAVAMSCTAAVLTTSTSSTASTATVSGLVYQDFNSNGIYDSSVVAGRATDIGIDGISVRAFDSSGAKVGETTSSANGAYSLSVSGAVSTQLRVEFEIPSTSPFSAFRNSFAGTNSGTSVQFVTAGATNVDYAVNVPGEYCQNNPNLSISRLCAGATEAVDASASAWVTRFDGGPYTTAHGFSDRYADWSATKVATKAGTGSILGMTWDPGTRRIFHSAYIRRHAELYEVGGQPVPAALFVTVPTGTTASAGVGGSTSFLVDLETLIAGDQFSNSNSAGPGYIPTNAARQINRMMNGTNDGGADDDGVDSDLVTGKDGVFEEVGKAGIGDIESDGNGNLWVVSLYDKNLYQVTLPASGAPTSMVSLGDITSGVTCVNGQSRPFSVRLWRGSLYLGVVCDGSDDFDPANPATLNNSKVSFLIRKYELASGTWTNFFGPQGLDASSGVVKGSSDTAFALNTRDNWNPWTDTFDTNNQNRYLTRPTPMLTEIEFDRDGSMILGFRDRNGDQQGTNDSEDPEGGNTNFPTLSSGDIYRVCRTGTGYTATDFVFEGGTGCEQRSFSGFGTEYYAGDFWFDRTQRGHGETSVGLMEQIPGFPDVILNTYDPFDADNTGRSFYSGGPRWLRNLTGEGSGAPNPGSGVMFYNWDGESGNPNTVGGFLKTNGMSDIEALCDQAPVQIGNRVWIDTDKDGVQDADEKPVAGVTVRLYAADGTTLLGTAITDAKGEYYFSSNVVEDAVGTGDNVGGGVAPGSPYLIRLDNPADYAVGGPLNGYSLTVATSLDSVTALDTSVDSNATTVAGYPQITTGVLLPGVNDHTYDVGFNRVESSAPQLKVSVGDYVWWDIDRDGIQDANETPIPGVTLTITNVDGSAVTDVNGRPVTTTVTDAKGKYSFDNLAPGQYKVTVMPPAGATATKTRAGRNRGKDSSTGSATSRNMTVNGDRDPTLDFGFYTPTASVGNYVWRDRNGDGVQGRSDSGVPGATLYLKGADGKPVIDAFGRKVRPQTTKKDGRYLFTGLLPGRYTVEIVYPRGWLATTKNRPGRAKNSSAFSATSKTLSAGESDMTLDFGMVKVKNRMLPATR